MTPYPAQGGGARLAPQGGARNVRQGGVWCADGGGTAVLTHSAGAPTEWCARARGICCRGHGRRRPQDVYRIEGARCWCVDSGGVNIVFCCGGVSCRARLALVGHRVWRRRDFCVLQAWWSSRIFSKDWWGVSWVCGAGWGAGILCPILH